MADKKEKDLELDEAVEAVSSEEASDKTEAKKSGKKAKEGKKQNFFTKAASLIGRFFKTMISELKKVTWFSRKQTYTSTLLVLVIMGIAAVAIGVLDLGLSKGLDAIAENINIIM